MRPSVLKKSLLIILVIMLTMSCLYADGAKNSQSVLFQDIAIRVGEGSFLFDKYSKMGANFLGGITLGLTKRVEVSIEAITPLVPDPFSDVIAGFEFGLSLLGDRVYSTNNAGNGLNVTLCAGLFFSDHNSKGQYLPTFLTLRVIPLTAGSPYSGRSEHLLPIGLAWNFQDNTVSLFVSIMMYDNYIKGTWRDYE
jgi:hypothetical protein